MAGKHNKPVGTSGSLRHEVGPGVDQREFSRDLSPGAKDAIESDVALAFKATMEQSVGAGAVNLSQLPENDLDFLWEVDGRKAKIEFTELVLATPPYKEEGQSAKIPYKLWSDKFCELVEKKNSKCYKGAEPVDLLVYTTHYAYVGNSFCVDLAAERLRHACGGANFDRIYYLDYGKSLANLYALKPYRAALPGRLRREYEQQAHWNMNLSNGTPVPGGTAFRIG